MRSNLISCCRSRIARRKVVVVVAGVVTTFVSTFG